MRTGMSALLPVSKMPANRTQDGCAASGNLSLANSHLLKLGQLICPYILSLAYGRSVMSLDSLTVNRNQKLKSVVIALVLFVSITGCKAKATNPALNFAPVPDTPPQNSYADLVAKVAPAVVTIRADKVVRAQQQSPFGDDPFFRGLFGDRGQQPPQETLQRALGSGVIVSADGYILTNHHVIEGAQDIKIDLNDGRTLDAKLIGSDAPSDLALLKVNAANLPTLTPGDSDKV